MLAGSTLVTKLTSSRLESSSSFYNFKILLLEMPAKLILCSILLLSYKPTKSFGKCMKILCIRKVKKFLMSLRSYSAVFVLNGLRKDGLFSKLKKVGGITKELPLTNRLWMRLKRDMLLWENHRTWRSLFLNSNLKLTRFWKFWKIKS